MKDQSLFALVARTSAELTSGEILFLRERADLALNEWRVVSFLAAAIPQDVRPVLIVRMRSIFLRVMRQESMPGPRLEAVLVFQPAFTRSGQPWFEANHDHHLKDDQTDQDKGRNPDHRLDRHVEVTKTEDQRRAGENDAVHIFLKQRPAARARPSPKN